MPTMTIRKMTRGFVIRAGGAVLGTTKNALELTEGDYPPVIYFPREDIAMAFFDRSETTSICPHKGTAIHYGIVAKSGLIADAAWSYESPMDEVSDLKDHLAFYPDKAVIEPV